MSDCARDIDYLVTSMPLDVALDYAAFDKWALMHSNYLQLLEDDQYDLAKIEDAWRELVPQFRAFYLAFRRQSLGTATLGRVWHSWLCLFVRAGVLPWHPAELNLATESEEELREAVRQLERQLGLACSDPAEPDGRDMPAVVFGMSLPLRLQYEQRSATPRFGAVAWALGIFGIRRPTPGSRGYSGELGGGAIPIEDISQRARTDISLQSEEASDIGTSFDKHVEAAGQRI